MLNLVDGSSDRYCDHISRRNLLKIGALGLGFGSLTLADLFGAEAHAAAPASTKSLINIHLGGGPSHQDMWDMKPDAPVEYRGEFNPISTNVPGMQICEYFPQLAHIADKFSLIRGLIGSVDEHSPSTTQTGYRETELKSIGGPPSIGSVIARLQGFNNGVAPYVCDSIDLRPGYLGPKYKAFSPGEAQSILRLHRIDANRLTNRANLLKTVDNLRRDADASGQFEAADQFTQRAVDVVLSGKMADALDLQKESPETLRRYIGSGEGRWRENERFLRARRLVEAGVRCVAMQWGGWDTHSDNFNELRKQLPQLDAGLTALITDLDQRGMLGDVTIAVWGEFGRSPRISNGAGRDHWPQVAAAFLAGGGIRGGQIVGATDRIAAEAAERPVHVHEVLATLYHNLGIDPQTTQIVDPAGRPRYLLDVRTPIRELV